MKNRRTRFATGPSSRYRRGLYGLEMGKHEKDRWLARDDNGRALFHWLCPNGVWNYATRNWLPTTAYRLRFAG